MTAFTAYIEWDPDTELYVGIVPGIQGAHTQGATLDELNRNLQEVLELCREVTYSIGILMGEQQQYPDIRVEISPAR